MTIRGERGVIATVGADYDKPAIVVTVVTHGNMDNVSEMLVLRLDANHAEAFEAAVRAARLEVLATAVGP